MDNHFEAKMNVSTDSSNISIAELKEEFIPGLLLNAGAISHYGDSGLSSKAMDKYSNLLEKDAVTALSGALNRIVSALAEADPRSISSNPSWFSRFTGKHLEKRVRYQHAREKVENLINEGNGYLTHVNETLLALEELLETYVSEIKRLKIFIQVGHEFLRDSTEEKNSDDLSLVFDKPRERFARRLANLATLLASHEMAAMQMEITRGTCIDIADRFNETIKVLVPVWRQHTLSLLSVNNTDPTIVRKANQAHEALLKSLRQNLEGFQK
ncbi:toxic anion resistance protein [Enterobacter hormaechei]|uniref:toxic anion resistance protein n=1 Tax=Enterobacter hormaechei TaxID=158836 RepID=UPI003314F1A0